MITRLNVASIYVLDKDEALDFYVNKLGLEKGNDVRQGDYRWLTIRVPGEQGATEVSLEQPGAPLHDEATAESLRELITKGALGGLVFITDDARELFETLKERGVTDFQPGAHRPLLRDGHGPTRSVREPHPDPPAGRGDDPPRGPQGSREGLRLSTLSSTTRRPSDGHQDPQRRQRLLRGRARGCRRDGP
jgi:catechol 2,3-dioxygenase-like lactoylglutathione lyase family enzyme